MKYSFVHKERASRLLIIFGGWGMDENVFKHIYRPGYDIMAIWDYRNFHIDWGCTSRYSEICILAWSMGVYAASQTLQAINHKITKKIAVAGTLMPIHDKYGIPEAIYEGTVANLSPITLRKFYRRMCATTADFEKFQHIAPSRPVDELKDELIAIADRTVLNTPGNIQWDLAIIGKNDRIFPFHHQKKAWDILGIETKIIPDAGHFLDLQEIIDSHFIDKDMVMKRFQSGTATYNDNAIIQIDVIERIHHELRTHEIDKALMAAKNMVLEIGSGSGMLSRIVARYVNKAKFTMWDLAAPKPTGLPLSKHYIFRNCDAESEIAKIGYFSIDHIVSSSTVQWFNSPKRFLENCRRILRKGGFVVLSTYTKGNLHQITDTGGIGLPLITTQSWIDIARRYFNIINVVEYERDLDFESPVEALRHLKLTGVNSLGRISSGNVNVRKIIQNYPMMLDGRYHLTYKPLILILQK